MCLVEAVLKPALCSLGIRNSTKSFIYYTNRCRHWITSKKNPIKPLNFIHFKVTSVNLGNGIRTSTCSEKHSLFPNFSKVIRKHSAETRSRVSVYPALIWHDLSFCGVKGILSTPCKARGFIGQTACLLCTLFSSPVPYLLNRANCFCNLFVKDFLREKVEEQEKDVGSHETATPK